MREHLPTGSRFFTFLVMVLIVWGCARAPDPVSTPSAHSPPAPSSILLLPAPANPEEQAYLGIASAGPFALTDIRTEVLIVEVFSMYCPHCQREAPHVNRLYRRIVDDPSLAGRVKLIGIGVGNTTYEVDLFRKTFEIPFPLFPDRSRQLALQLEIRETPTFVAFVNGPDGNLQRILHAPGPIGNLEDFLNRVLELAYLENRPS